MNDLFLGILKRGDSPAASVFTADEVAHWPNGALPRFLSLGVVREAEPAKEVLCDECEDGCWIKPRIRCKPHTGKAVGTYFCRRHEDIGSFKVDLSRMRRWAFSLAGLAKAVSKAVRPTGKLTELAPERLALLGTVKLDGKNRELFLARGAAWPDANDVLGGVVRLKTASHPAILTVAGMPSESLLSSLKVAARPLAEIATLDEKGLHVSIEGAFPDVEPRPWADIPNEPITLDKFMEKYCEKRTPQLRRSRRRALLAAAWHGTITMPALAAPRKSGQPNRYYTHDLLAAWQGFLDEITDLPPLLT